MNISLVSRPHLKVLHYLFLPLLLVVASLCTQNSSALSFPTGWVSNTVEATPYFRSLVGGNFTAWSTQVYYEFNNTAPIQVQGLEIKNSSNSNLSINGHTIYAIGISTKGCIPRGFRPSVDQTHIKYIGYDAQQFTATDYSYTYYFYNDGPAWTGTLNPAISFNCTTANSQLQVSSFVSFSKLDAAGSTDYTSVLNDILDGVEDLNTTYSSLETQIIALNNKMQTQTNTLQQQYSQPRGEAQQAQTDGNTSATSSSSDATTTGSTLLSGLTSLVAALNVSPAANCKLDMDLGNVDFGEADLCSISPPVQFQIISSLVVIGFAVPLSLAAAHKMVELFRSFA